MKIAYGNSRMEKKWKNNEISWEDFCKEIWQMVLCIWMMEA